MSLELFLSKKLKEAEENDWLLNNNDTIKNDLDGEHNENFWQTQNNGQNGYLVEREV